MKSECDKCLMKLRFIALLLFKADNSQKGQLFRIRLRLIQVLMSLQNISDHTNFGTREPENMERARYHCATQPYNVTVLAFLIASKTCSLNYKLSNDAQNFTRSFFQTPMLTIPSILV